jgi:acyl-CoA thioesterase-1
MKSNIYLFILFCCLINVSCESKNEEILQLDDDIPEDTNSIPKNIKILSLGDSYTIGESVCEKCKFPEQLKERLIEVSEKDITFNLQVIARTGWTTTSLIDAIENENISSDFNLVTLLIGVNNQYQRKDFSLYQTEFPVLVSSAIKAASNKNNLIIISIPDYAFTPVGKADENVSEEIDMYNNFAKDYCRKNEITFVNITDITRQGLINTALVASDNLHPSELAYSKFVDRLLPFALQKLKN